MTFKSPMLAKDYDESQLPFPRLASFKLDGWRGVIHEAVVTTRSGKPVRNAHTQSLFGRAALNGLDGELVVGKWNEQETFNRTDAGMKKEAGTPDVMFYVFDCYDIPNRSYVERAAIAIERIEAWRKTVSRELGERVVFLRQTTLRCLADLEAFEVEALDQCFEGVMLRDPDSPYKYGRSTVREGYLLKVKRFTHEEATIISIEEQMSNGNEAFLDELGRTKRTSHQENLTPTGMAGAAWVSSPLWPTAFKISLGSLSHAENKEWWSNISEKIGQTVRFKYLAHGVKDVPRHGLFDGFRAPEDADSLA